MRTFLKTVRPSLVCLLIFTLLLGIIYPCVVWGIGQVCFHRKANGSLFRYQDGSVLGSELIGQNFASHSYFHPRPSAAGNQGYDASNSSGSNLGPTSQKLVDAVTQRVSDYRVQNMLMEHEELPGDAVTASGSGLDPHISVENAKLQAVRVASKRGFSLEQVMRLIDEYTEGRWEFFGKKRINVLRINLALDQMTATTEEGSS
jgi:potassium-transporting ATPase KdpC subunit